MLTPFFVLSGLEDWNRRPKRVPGVGSNRFLPICWHILSHVSSGLSLLILILSDSYPSERSVHPAVMSVEKSHQTSSPAPFVRQFHLLFDVFVTERDEFLTRCVYALFELMYVHTSVPFRGIYMD